ncbi:MAG: serine/threonine-protein kinase, partial [Myxococcota bacterium]
LHAAHELRDVDGNSTELVHRDISPQNIFVTYDGGVKVLDFGIASATGRVTKTVAGEVKGKASYMSPEQASGTALDRRSDVFSLGVVYFELLSGRRLFKRATQVATIQAVVGEAIPPVRRFRPAVSDARSAICARALQRDRDARYESAASMRRALASTNAAGAVLEEKLAELMGGLFQARIAEKKELVRKLRQGDSITSVPRGELDVEVELPSVSIDTSDLEGQQRRRQGGPQRTLAPVFALLFVVLLTLVAWFVRSSNSPWSASAVPAERTFQPSAGDGRSTVDVHIASEPSGAQVSIDGLERGRTPLRVELMRGERPLRVQLMADGFEPFDTEVVPNLSSRLMARLRALPDEALPPPANPPAERAPRTMRRSPAKMAPRRAPAFEPW